MKVIRVPESAIIVPVPEAEANSKALIAHVREFAGKQCRFAYSLNSVGQFADTLYLAPCPKEPFIDLENALVEIFPGYLPYRGRFDAVVPHLTVVHGPGLPLDDLEEEVSRHARFRAGIKASCETLALIENTSGLWRVRERFSLAMPRERSIP